MTSTNIVHTLPHRLDGNDRDTSKAQENFDALQAYIERLVQKLREIERRLDAAGI